MPNSDQLLIIFTRNPELGKVKSRLAADVGKQAALDIYKFLLEHTHKVTSSLKVDKQVWYSNEVPKVDIWNEGSFSKHDQLKDDDLGKRMQQAFEEGFNKGYKNISIIGSDLYDISQADLENAFAKLKNNEAVIGPASDGGFYFLGLSKMISEIFANKNWGKDSVLADCLKDLEKYNFEQLPVRNDVDYLSDIINEDAFKPFLKLQDD